MHTETKEDRIIFCIKNSYLPADVKQELTDYVRSHNDAAIRAAFRLGQMDMRESAAVAVRNSGPEWYIHCRSCTEQAALVVENLEVI